MQGGAEQSVKLLAENFLKHGNTVAIYCADAKDGKKTVEEINGVTVYRCTTGKFDLYKYSYKKNSVSALEKVTQKLRCYYNPDCVKDFKKSVIGSNQMLFIQIRFMEYLAPYGKRPIERKLQ